MDIIKVTILEKSLDDKLWLEVILVMTNVKIYAL